MNLAQPEESLGFSYNQPLNKWEIQKILDALSFATDSSEGSDFAKRRLKKKLLKDVEKWLKTMGKDGLKFLTPNWRHSICCGRLYQGDFSDYFGWEFRGWGNEDDSQGYAAKFYWQDLWIPKWGGQNCNRVLVIAEQGLGDEIFFSSIIPEVMIRVNEVIYECDERLHTILQRSLPGLRCRPTRAFEDRRLDYGSLDGYIPAGELMRMFRRKREHFPKKAFLKPNALRLREMEPYKGKVGISWKGRQGSIDPFKLHTDAISLQYNEGFEEIKEPHIDLREDIEGVLALVSVLERVVTVPTTVHHISGAAGVKTQIVLPEITGEHVTDIKWDVSPIAGPKLWYQNVTVYESNDARLLA